MAFTVPGMGQFEWKVVSMGIASVPSAFQWLVELVAKGINNIVVYINDLIIHLQTHDQHLKTLDEVLQYLQPTISALTERSVCLAQVKPPI